MDEQTSTQALASGSLVSGVSEQLMKVLPFSEMAIDDVHHFVRACSEQYFGPDEIILSPSDGVPKYLYLIRQGHVVGQRAQNGERVTFELEAGEMFSIGSVLTGRAVTTDYRAQGDCFVLCFAANLVADFGVRCPVFLDFLKNRFSIILQKSQESLRQHFAAKAAETQLQQNTLGAVCHRPPVSVTPETPLRAALQTMDERRVGSILIIEQSGRLVGILTRYDLLKRVVLAEIDLGVPVSSVMTPDLKTLNADDTVEAASMLMTHASIRHVPVLEGDRVIGLVSERDLFAFQRFSMGNVGAEIRAAKDLDALKVAAEHIRQYARNLLSQGVTGHRLTGLVSYLNDSLTDQIIHITMSKFEVNEADFCWLALGSEGREEQTIATDQDNAMILADHVSDEQIKTYLLFARAVNESLDACGFPLCKGNVMASNPDYCRREKEWLARCTAWIDGGSPQDLLDASIFFDFRAIAGNRDFTESIQKYVSAAAQRTPRFIAFLAQNAMKWTVPLTMFGGIETTKIAGQPALDMKMQATALVVDFARIYSLAHGITERNTKERLQAVALALGDDALASDWVSSFEYLQSLRLRAQMQEPALGENPNAIALSSLSKVDQVILKAALQVMRGMHSRLKLDYVR